MFVAWRLDAFHLVFTSSSEPLGVVLGAAIIFTVGLLDDLCEWSRRPRRSSGIVLAGGVMSLLGVTMFYFRIPFFGLVVLSPDLAPLVTVLWVVGMANAVNLIDGLDGLAAGIVAIAAGAFFLYAQRLNDAGLLAEGDLGPLVAVIVLGMCLGFLPAQLPSGADLHGRLRRAAARPAHGRLDDRRRRVVPASRSAARPTSSSPRCSSRSSSSACRSSTPRSRSSVAPPDAPASRLPTRTTCITG